MAYCVSSIGLRHVKCSLLISRFLRKQIAGLKIVWFAANPAAQYLEAMGEAVESESKELVSLSDIMEKHSVAGRVSGMWRAMVNTASVARENYLKVRRKIEDCDTLVQDEF
jgi:hypothetical protein